MRFEGFTDLLQSERGAFCALVLVLATLLVLTGKIDGATWIDFTKYLGGALIASKTITTAVETHATKEPQIPKATVVRRNKEPAV